MLRAEGFKDPKIDTNFIIKIPEEKKEIELDFICHNPRIIAETITTYLKRQ